MSKKIPRQTKADSKSKLTLHFTVKCLEILPLSLREIVSRYLQYEERQTLRRSLNVSSPELPLLTVEEMARENRYFPIGKPHSEDIYIPYIPRWILIVDMLLNLRPSQGKRSIYWQCPFCKEYHNIVNFTGKNTKISFFEIHFVDRNAKTYTICSKDATNTVEDIKEQCMNDGDITEIKITPVILDIDSKNTDMALNNTYSPHDLAGRYNCHSSKNEIYFILHHARDEEYTDDWKVNTKKELSLVGAKPLTRISVITDDHRAAIMTKKDKVPFDVDEFVELMIAIYDDM